MRNKKIILSIVIALIVGLFISQKIYPYLSKDAEKTLFLNKKLSCWQALEQEIKKDIAKYNIKPAILIKDLQRGWTITYNHNRLFPSASIVKIPIMATCFYAADKGKIDLKRKVYLNNSHKVSGSGILKNEANGKEFSIEKLIELMIAESDNTATNILIDVLGFKYLNGAFKKLGLKNTNISRKMMYFKYRRKGIENYTTSEDIAYLLERIYRKKFLNKNISEKCLELLKRQKIKDRIPAKLPSDIMVANKTGLERGVCHDVGIVFTPNGDFLICALTRHKYKTAKIPKAFISEVSLKVYNCYQ